MMLHVSYERKYEAVGLYILMQEQNYIYFCFCIKISNLSKLDIVLCINHFADSD
jgi:hypothetical protein